MVKTVAIIGAGCSGLASIKCCVDEGLEPTCFERTEDIGGLWRFKEVPEENRASIYNSVIINTSKEMMCYSDYPIPEDYPNYMHNSKVLKYFRQYAEHFHLLKYIQFNTTVLKVKKHPNFNTTGQWFVITECNAEQKEHVFDAVMVCAGHHTHPNLPLSSFPGLENFKGQYFHSRDYKNPLPLKDKRVIVVGVGNTGVDLAVETCTIAKQVFLSTRRGTWLLNRVSDDGFPLDIVFFTRFYTAIQTLLPMLANKFLEYKVNSRVNHENFGLKPQHSFISQHPTVSDNLPNCIIAGKVLMKTNVKRFTETDVIFEDGTVEKDIDVVIFATGYHFSFPFCDDSVLKVEKNEIPLYKMVFPPLLEKHTLACIGYIQPIGAIMAVSEMQARWATRVFKGLKKIPSKEGMLTEIMKRKEEMQNRYVKSDRHTIQVDYVPYMDEIAEEIDCKPNWMKILLTDPKLAWEVLFGPCSPYQYRITGPVKWKGARHAILTQMDRVIKPTKTRVLKESSVGSSFSFGLMLLGLLIIFAAIYFSI